MTKSLILTSKSLDVMSFGPYKGGDVKQIDFTVAAARIAVASTKNNEYFIQFKGEKSAPYTCDLTDGKLTLKLADDNKYIDANSSVPKSLILITIPENAFVESFSLTTGAGKVKTNDLRLNARKTLIKSGASKIDITGINSQDTVIECGVGSVKCSGLFTGTTKIECGVGKVELDVLGNEADYSMSAEIGLGKVVLNRNGKKGIGSYSSGEKKKNHIEVDCALGKVEVKIKNNLLKAPESLKLLR